jgi:hypothetical protein
VNVADQTDAKKEWSRIFQYVNFAEITL